MALFPGLPRSASTRKVKPIWILLKQETVSGSGISWAICKSAPHPRHITMPAAQHSVFYRPDALPAAQPTASKHLRQFLTPNQQLFPTPTWGLMNLLSTKSSEPSKSWRMAVLQARWYSPRTAEMCYRSCQSSLTLPIYPSLEIWHSSCKLARRHHNHSVQRQGS